LGDDVYDVLLEMLTSGDLEPDTPLAIDRLAEPPFVLPTPVREALARLEHTGLVMRAAHRGYRVAPPMPREELLELVDAREILEVAAMERAMQNPVALLRGLESAFHEHERAAEKLTSPRAVQDPKKVHEYFDADWLFHQVILDHCGNRYISRCVNSLSFSNHRMRQTNQQGITDAPFALAEHQAILDAVRSGEVSRAVSEMRAHLDQVRMRSTGA